MSDKKKKMDELVHSRRRFIRDTSILLASAGVAAQTRIEFVNDLARKLIPSAMADEGAAVKRLLFIPTRSGSPLIGFGAPKAFADLSDASFPNCPFTGSQLQKAANGLYLTPDAAPLMKHADNLAITQGIDTEGGHTSLFNFWEGGRGAGMTSPIIDLADQNTSKSVFTGVQVHQGQENVVTHRENGLAPLTQTEAGSFRDNFKKPSLALSEASAGKVMEAAAKLSRRQALRMTASIENARTVSTEHGKAAQLMSYDYRAALDLSEMDKEFSNGSGRYKTFGEGLGYILKAMSLNLVNSASVVLPTGDWHGYQGRDGNRTYFQEVAKKLGKTVDFLKATPDPASLTGESLWDTTTIVMGSEFTRRDRSFGRDNGDGGSQGILMLGKNVNGGFYGDALFNMSDQNTPVRYTGIEASTGKALPMDNRNSTAELYHTISYLIGARTANPSRALTAMLKKSIF